LTSPKKRDHTRWEYIEYIGAQQRSSHAKIKLFYGPGSRRRAKEQEADVSWEEKDDDTIYKVVVNHEEQYSIWPEGRPNAKGWNDVGKSGRKPECLAYIKEIWTDMRPLSLRKKMEEDARAVR
jgi:MbtH protein